MEKKNKKMWLIWALILTIPFLLNSTTVGITRIYDEGNARYEEIQAMLSCYAGGVMAITLKALILKHAFKVADKAMNDRAEVGETILIESIKSINLSKMLTSLALPLFILANGICNLIVTNPDNGYVTAIFLPFEFIATFIFWILALICISMLDYSITVTDRRVIGEIRRRSLDLPIDSISAVGIGRGKSIIVSTSSGTIKFKRIANNSEIRDVLSKLIMQRQEDAKKQIVSSPVAENVSNADELKKFKELLDSGVITQEEFDAKKKQLLGL